MENECKDCKAMNICNTAVQYGSVMCQMNRLKSGQTKAELMTMQERVTKYCPHCGRPIN